MTKVLLIDDDSTFGNIILLTLNELGYETYYQTSLTAIKHILEEIKPNIIILDVEIGKKNGIDAIPLIRTVTDIPIIFISSHVDDSIAARAVNMGGIAYLKKPFETEVLIAYIDRHARYNEKSTLEFGNCTLNSDTRELYYNKDLLKILTITEYKLLKLFVLNLNTDITREKIKREIINNTPVSEHSINNFIRKLRALLAVDNQLELLVIQGIGYKLMNRKLLLSE